MLSIQVSTIIHEMTHHISVGNTRDYAISKLSCEILALKTPAQTTYNAYSYEYFIINDPPVDDADPSKPATSIMSEGGKPRRHSTYRYL